MKFRKLNNLCNECGNMIYSWRKFCCRECYFKNRHDRTRSLIKCDLCKKEFIRRHDKIKEKNYCSTSCSGKVNISKYTITDEHKEKIRKIALEKNYGKWMKGKTGNKGSFTSERTSGENSFNWKGGITPLNNKIRRHKNSIVWRNKIFERDNYTCVICNSRGNKLNADHYPKMFQHIISDNNIKCLNDALLCSQLWDINNGRTLCVNCHKEVTKEQMKTYWKNQYTNKKEKTK